MMILNMQCINVVLGDLQTLTMQNNNTKGERTLEESRLGIIKRMYFI